MDQLGKLESSLETVFKAAPKLPDSAKKSIVSWLPWINLILGVLSLWAAYALWHWAHWADTVVSYLNAAYGTTGTTLSRMSLGLWLALIVVAFQGVLFLAAFQPTKSLAKRGWSLMFYATLVNVIYGIVLLFTDYGTFGNFIGYLLGSVVGFWILFQIKPSYTKS